MAEIEVDLSDDSALETKHKQGEQVPVTTRHSHEEVVMHQGSLHKKPDLFVDYLLSSL